MAEHISSIPSKRLLLFDGHAIAFHSWFASSPNRVVPGFFDLLEDAIERHDPTHIIVTFDPKPPTFRHKLYPEYKADRPPAPEGLIEDCERVFQLLKSLELSSCTVDGYEADDILGTLAARASLSGFSTVIITSDLDLLQLVASNIKVETFSQYWPTRFFDVEGATKRFYGLEPQNIPDYKALAGDKSDNLPGVPGIGQVSATAVLKEFDNLDDVYENLDKISALPFRGARRVSQLLAASREQAFLMRTLARIVCDVPIEINIDSAEVTDSILKNMGYIHD